MKSGSTEDHSTKKFSLGAATRGVEALTTDQKTELMVSLAFHIFNRLDRQLVNSVERTLNLSAPHRVQIRRLVARLAEQKPSLSQILKPLRKHDHSTAYALFVSVCKMIAIDQRYDKRFLESIVVTGREMGLTQAEIYQVIEKYGLAV